MIPPARHTLNPERPDRSRSLEAAPQTLCERAASLASGDDERPGIRLTQVEDHMLLVLRVL